MGGCRVIVRGLVAGVLGGALYGVMLGMTSVVDRPSVGGAAAVLVFGPIFGALFGLVPGLGVGLALSLTHRASTGVACVVAFLVGATMTGLVWIGLSGGIDGAASVIYLVVTTLVPGLLAAWAAPWIRRPPTDA